MARDRELPPPLEMICLHALWELEEGNVEDVRRLVSRQRPLAYTTVLTLLDRLSRRGAVSRRREGRGFRYQPTVEREKLRRLALSQFLDVHFEGSVAKLRIFIDGSNVDRVNIDSSVADGSILVEDPVAESTTLPEAPAAEEVPAPRLSKAATACSGGPSVRSTTDSVA